MFSIDVNELKFSNQPPLYIQEENSSREIGVIQAAKDRHYLYKVCQAINLGDVNPDRLPIIGLWPYIGLRDIIKAGSFMDYIFSFIENYRLLRKWRCIYKPLSLMGLKPIEGCFYPLNIKNHYLAYLLFLEVRRKKSFKDLKINNLYIGDLIHSSYIRFREVSEIKYNDFFIFYLILKSLQIQSNIRKLLKKFTVKFYITSFSSYVQHGVAVREFINAGVQVYSLGNTKYVVKKHLNYDFSHKLPYWRYLDQSEHFLTASMCEEADQVLGARMSGNIDRSISYMEKSAYLDVGKQIPGDIVGVLFLHDFLDGPFDHRYWLFDDLYQWAHHTIKLISDNRLPIAIKPHPNQIAGNTTIINKLKNEFPDLIWLDPEISNSRLFEVIDVGISVFGTILVELAYMNKVGIAAGDHPAADFSISYQPKTVQEYEYLLLGVKKLIPFVDLKKKAIRFFATQNYLLTDQEIKIPKISVPINWSNSQSLIDWMNISKSEVF